MNTVKVPQFFRIYLIENQNIWLCTILSTCTIYLFGVSSFFVGTELQIWYPDINATNSITKTAAKNVLI